MSGADPAGFPDTETLNRMSDAAFGDALALLFEHAPSFAARLARTRPFSTDDDLLAAAGRVGRGLPGAELLELINAHPQIGATEGLSDASRLEQGAIDHHVDQELANLQAVYEARFGFRYLVFVAGRSRAALMDDLRRSLGATRDAELQRALSDTLAIAADRLARFRREGG